jgi:mannose/fructose-specific phosphotransferase system component IIA
MPNTYAASGVNVPMLLETLLTRPRAEDAKSLAETAVSSGSAGVVNIVERFNEYRARREASESG